jgi:hypothetical protein
MNIQSLISSDSIQSRLANGLRYAKAGRHYIKPCAILAIVVLSYAVEFLFLLTEKLHTATVWAVKTLIEDIDYSTLPQEEEPDTLLDDTVTKLRELSIRELKKVASMQRLPKYSSLNKAELIDALIEQGRKASEV